MRSQQLIFLLCIWGLIACQPGSSPPSSVPPQFQLLKKERTGLDFENVLKQSPDFNVFAYMYFFNGGGVAAGDFNQDSLVDLFFTSNMGPNKLFLNQGQLKFTDVTESAQLRGQEGWTSGVSVVDINNDGLLDLYVSQIGDYGTIQGQNQLYICQKIENGIPVFQDQAEKYGLNLQGFATQASFFDYDLDGDLDMFQLNHTLHQNGTFGRRKEFTDQGPHSLSGDRLFRNDSKGDQVQFTDVTSEAGILSTVIGYGLGIVTGDINLDGWPDIYIGNDFHENDYLYLNQQNGTFKESLTEQMMHTSRFSMGVDMADINNDGHSEIISLDMLPYDPYILKTSLGEDGFNIFQFKIGHGYNHQYARNNLQLNNGNGTFSEIGMFSGVYATDWSWSSLFLDFDHDGYKDLFVSNGIPRRMNDIDYVNFRLGDPDLKWKTDNNHLEEDELDIVDQMPQVKIPNGFFRNRGDVTFESLAASILNDQATYSNGAAYADLDNDGDLDIVVNNIDDEPFIYQNLTIEEADSSRHYLAFQFSGPPTNRQAIGAKILVRTDSALLSYEHYPVRGYQSSMAPGIHIGIGNPASIKEVQLIWPDQTWQTLDQLAFDETNWISWRAELPTFDFASLQKPLPYASTFQDITASSELAFVHKENPFVEFNREGLIPHMMSSEGPALAVGDVNGDGREDVFIGSAKRERSALFLQQSNGNFTNTTPKSIILDSLFEDVDAIMEDLDKDGDLDLVVASGGNEYRGESEARKQRAYINNGNGDFIRKDLFPEAFMTASCVLPADINGDGWIDLFFGARAVPSSYGQIPTSYLYLNRGNGEFDLATDQYHPELSQVGLVKDGAWQDIDQDGDMDLLLAVEWEPIQIFVNQGDHFDRQSLDDRKGWWNYVLPHDFDGDGDIDILAGNLGQNARFRPTKDEPVRMYVADFDENDQAEQILTYYLEGQELPFANHAELTKQMVSLKKKYLYAKDLASASLTEVFGEEKMEKAQVFEANFFRSVYYEQTAAGWKTHPLPDAFQYSTQEAALLLDLDQDGQSEVVMGGNFYDCNIEMGRYDAHYGSILSGIGTNQMQHSLLGSVAVKGQVRRIAQIQIGNQIGLLFAKNNDTLQLVQYLPPSNDLP